MPIMNKDGTVFRLKGPNPIMKNQARWEDQGAIIYHNFEWHGVVIPDPKSSRKLLDPVVHKAPEPVSVPEPVVHKAPEPVPVPILKPIEPVCTEPAQVVTEIQGSVKVHCLPGTIKIHRDDLYDEKHVTITYGAKFLFDANVERKDDLMLVLWTPRNTVTPGSIIFPKTGHARWWRVKDVEPVGIGVRLICAPSDEQPSFAD